MKPSEKIKEATRKIFKAMRDAGISETEITYVLIRLERLAADVECIEEIHI